MILLMAPFSAIAYACKQTVFRKQTYRANEFGVAAQEIKYSMREFEFEDRSFFIKAAGYSALNSLWFATTLLSYLKPQDLKSGKALISNKFKYIDKSLNEILTKLKEIRALVKKQNETREKVHNGVQQNFV
jgi:hypothetical protein